MQSIIKWNTRLGELTQYVVLFNTVFSGLTGCYSKARLPGCYSVKFNKDKSTARGYDGASVPLALV